MSLTKPLGGRAVLMKQRSGRAGAGSALHEGRADEADMSKTDYRMVYERHTHSFPWFTIVLVKLFLEPRSTQTTPFPAY